jgi:hypothetical protein
VHWAAERALAVEVTAKARPARVDGTAGSGSVPVLLDTSGFVEVRAINDAGIDHRCLGPFAVIPAPVEEPLPVPMPRPEWPEPTLIEPPQAMLPQLPMVELPVVTLGPTPLIVEPELGSRPSVASEWPMLLSVRCPIDIVSLITNGPQLDIGVGPDAKED